MIFEIVLSSLSAIAAGFSYAAYVGAKKFNSLATQAASISVANSEVAKKRALVAAACAQNAATTLSDILAKAGHMSDENSKVILAVANLSSTAGRHVVTAAAYSAEASMHSAAAESFKLAAYDYSI